MRYILFTIFRISLIDKIENWGLRIQNFAKRKINIKVKKFERREEEGKKMLSHTPEKETKIQFYLNFLPQT